MSRRALKILKISWALLAWVLFASGVIGCSGTALNAGPSEAGVSNMGTSDAAPAPVVFESYFGESFYDYPNPRSHSSVSIMASGAVSTDSCHAQASAADLADFIAEVTSPEVLAFFADPRICGDTVDGQIYGTLTLKGHAPVKKSFGCGGVVDDLMNAAVAAVTPVCARAQADASATDAGGGGQGGRDGGDNSAQGGADGGSDDLGSGGIPVAVGPSTFVSYTDETYTTLPGHETRTVIIINAAGEVAWDQCTGQAPADALAIFIGKATSPNIVGPFLGDSPCGMIADGGENVTLRLANRTTYTRSIACAASISDLIAAARALAAATSLACPV